MEGRICKRCGKTFYFDSEFCLDCKNFIKVQNYENMSNEEIFALYKKFNDELTNKGALSKDNINVLELLLTANDEVDHSFQMNCVNKGYFDMPEIFYNASKQVHDQIIESIKGLKPTDEKLKRVFESLQYSFGYSYDKNGNQTSKLKRCKELICVQNDIKQEEDIYFPITLKIVNGDDIIEIKDALSCLINEEEIPYEFMDIERVDKGKTIVFQTGRDVSAFRSTFDTNYDTFGGFIDKYIDSTYIQCDNCNEESSPIAQISCKTFNCEGVIIVSKCLKCGKYTVNYFG